MSDNAAFPLDRRRFLATTLGAALSAVIGANAFSAVLASGGSLRPFAESRVVSRYASGLFFSEEVMPPILRDAIQAEFDRTDVAQISLDEERRRAKFFALLAVRCIASAALRRAGYAALAAECEGQTSLWEGMLAAAGAQHTIGKQYARCQTPEPAASAYTACAHTATAAYYAGHEDIAVLVDTGTYCARALVESIPYVDPQPEELTLVWVTAANAINVASGLRNWELLAKRPPFEIDCSWRKASHATRSQ